MYRTHKRGLNSKLVAVCDGKVRPIILLLTKGQMSDHMSDRKGAALLFDTLPLLGDTEHRVVPRAREDAHVMTATGCAPP
jgi:hypothetical protein